MAEALAPSRGRRSSGPVARARGQKLVSAPAAAADPPSPEQPTAPQADGPSSLSSQPGPVHGAGPASNARQREVADLGRKPGGPESLWLCSQSGRRRRRGRSRTRASARLRVLGADADARARAWTRHLHSHSLE